MYLTEEPLDRVCAQAKENQINKITKIWVDLELTSQCRMPVLVRRPEARVGDEVVLFGRQGKEVITGEEVLKQCDLSPWPSPLMLISSTMHKHIPVVYFKEGRPYKIVNRIGEQEEFIERFAPL